MSFMSLMSATLTVKKPTITKDSSGGPVYSGGTILFEGVPCTIQPVSTDVALKYFQRNLKVSHQIFTPTDMKLRPNMRAEVREADGELRWFVVRGYYNAAGLKTGGPGRHFVIEADENPGEPWDRPEEP